MRSCFLIVFLIFSCAGSSSMIKPEIENSKIFPANFDKVWSATVATLSEKELPIKVIEKESGIITTEFVIFADGVLADDEIKNVSKRPSIFLGTWKKGRYYLSLFVSKIEDHSTKIKINSHIEAYEDNMTNKWHVCYSRGVIEKSIFNSITEKF